MPRACIDTDSQSLCSALEHLLIAAFGRSGQFAAVCDGSNRGDGEDAG
jgi:hypothetical protein